MTWEMLRKKLNPENGKSVSENEFYENLKKLIGDTELESFTEEWISNTEENRNKYLK